MTTDVITLSNYKKPEIQEKKSEGYVTYGEKNLGFAELIRLAKDSPTNAAVLHGINRLTYGKGLAAKNSDGGNAAQFAKAMAMLPQQDTRRAIIDGNIMANVALLVTREGDTAKIQHIPTQMVAPSIVDEEGEINSFFYSPNLGKEDGNVRELEEYPNFDLYPNEKQTIKYIKSYSPGNWYFNDPDYQGSIAYMDVEIENGKYHVNNVKTRFSAQTAITLFNGDPGKDKRAKVKRQVKAEYSGSEGSTLAVNFVDKDGTAPDYNHFPVRDLHKQQEYIGKEATEKILLGHGVVSPMIFGIKDNTGLGNNAEELESSFVLFNNMTIIPKQNVFIEGIESIFRHYGITLDFYFKTLKPNEFIDQDTTAEYDEQSQALSKVNTDLDYFISLGEDSPEGFELFSTAPVDSDDLEDEVLTILKQKEDKRTRLQKIVDYVKLTGTGKATPIRDSEQDNNDFAVRYRYKGKDSGKNTRTFCSTMLSADKLYRKEDIVRMENLSVNPGFGLDGVNKYSIWLYKGGGLLSNKYPGGTCRHYWQREIYLKKGTGSKRRIDLQNQITVAESRRLGFRPETNDKKVGTTPHSNYTTRQ